MEFHVLGPVRVRRADADIALTGTLQRTLVAVLLAHAGEPVPVGALTEALWPNQPGGAQRLQVHVSRLRSLLGEADRVVFAHDAYRLRLDPGELDAERFERLATEAAELAEADPARSAERAAEALTMWQGTPYGDLDVPLLAAEVTRLAERRLAVIELRYEAELRAGRHAAAATDLTDLVREFPLRERLCGLLMTALYRSGRQADALAAFRVTRRTLVDELGLEPGPELRAIEQRILAGEPVEVDQEIAKPEVPAQLPPQVPDFVGRAAELSDLDAMRAAATVSVLAGTAGVGKTALAIRWAHRVRADFPDGQLYVDLRGFGPDEPLAPADVLAAFLRGLGLDGAAIPQDASERAARFRTLVDGRRMLLVLDNARTAEQVRPLLPGTPTVFVLVTSRDALTGLAAREGARRVDLDRMPDADAVELVGAAIGARAEAEPDAVDALVARCARLPLALRVVVELINLRPGMPVAEVVHELVREQHRLDALDVAEDAHSSVRAVFSWSYGRLTPDAADLFRRCGLFPGRELDTYALAALAGTTLAATRRAVDRLVRAHLVDQLPDGRVQLHDLLGAYAAELARRTDGKPDRAAALERLHTYYLNAAAAATIHIGPHELAPRPTVPPTDLPVPAFADRDEALRWLDAERVNLVTIATHALHHGHPRITGLLAEILFRYLDHGHFDDALVVHQNALIAASTRGDRLAEAHAADFLCRTYIHIGELEQALEYGEQAYESYLVLGERRFQAIPLMRMGWAHFLRGYYADALSCFEQMLEEYGDLPEDGTSLRAEALRCVGVAHSQVGRLAEAERHLLEALDLARATGDAPRERSIRSNLARVYDKLGQHEQALEHLEWTRASAREIGDSVLEAHLYELGGVYWALGRREDAFAATWRCLGLCREYGLTVAESRTLNELGRLHRLAGEPEEAIEHHHDALAISEETGERHTQATAHHRLGDAHADLGDLTLAREHWHRAADLYNSLGVPEAAEVREKLAG